MWRLASSGARCELSVHRLFAFIEPGLVAHEWLGRSLGIRKGSGGAFCPATLATLRSAVFVSVALIRCRLGRSYRSRSKARVSAAKGVGGIQVRCGSFRRACASCARATGSWSLHASSLRRGPGGLARAPSCRARWHARRAQRRRPCHAATWPRNADEATCDSNRRDAPTTAPCDVLSPASQRVVGWVRPQDEPSGLD